MDELTKKQIADWSKNIEILYDELENNSSSRSCVIVAATYLDMVLRNLLGSYLTSPNNKSEDGDLFSGFGPLSSFSGKILITFRLGLISDYEFRTLQVVRKIRNTFAHNLFVDSLNDFQSLLLSVIPQRELIPVKDIPLASSNGDVPPVPIIPEIDETSPRDVFVKIVMCLSNLLAARCLFGARQKRYVPEDFKSLIDIDNQRISAFQASSEEVEKLIDLEIKVIDLYKEKLKQLLHDDCAKPADIKECQKEIDRLERDLENDYEELKFTDTLVDVSKYSRDQIQKAFDEQL